MFSLGAAKSRIGVLVNTVGRSGAWATPSSVTSNGASSGLAAYMPVRNATKKAAGVTTNTSDSAGRRLGVKCTAGTEVKPGFVLVRQRGLTFHAGLNVMVSKDHTLHALVEGEVAFSRVQVPGKRRDRTRTLVNVLESNAPSNDRIVEFTAQMQNKLIESHKYRLWRKENKKNIFMGLPLTRCPVVKRAKGPITLPPLVDDASVEGMDDISFENMHESAEAVQTTATSSM